MSTATSSHGGEIRRAAVDDVPALLALVEQYWRFENLEGFGRERVEPALCRLLSQPALGAGWLALDADGTPGGYLLAVYVFSLEHLGLTAEIDEFFVLPQLRGQRVGTRLLQAAEQAFVAAGCTNVSLQLGRGNDRARALYARCGYCPRPGFELLDKTLPYR
jgi:GNAT superfamily N-acetyltransferase